MSNAEFDKVNYTFYSDELGRAVVPTAEEFDALKFVNIQEFKKLMPYIVEMETDGIAKAVCMMIEADYSDAQALQGNGAAIAAESLGGHSVTYAGNAKAAEMNAQSTATKKLNAIKLFCALNIGVK